MLRCARNDGGGLADTGLINNQWRAKKLDRTENQFFWYELMTSDPEAAGDFYRRVIGWSLTPYEGSAGAYTLLGAGEASVGGIMKIPAEACHAGAGPAWTGYVHVGDVDGTAKRIEEAGGTVLRAPDDIATVGRFAVVADPGGAVFQLLAPAPSEGGDPPLAEPWAPGTIGWRELYSGAGQDAAFAFYSSLFGWETIEELDMGPMGKYRIFGKDGVQAGGMMDKPPHVPRSTWTFYVCVDGIDAATSRIREAGGTIAMGPHEVPGGNWIVHAVDPQGAAFAATSSRR